MLFNIDKNQAHSRGIYCIKDERGDIIYIGKALDFHKRYLTHQAEINNLGKNNIFNFIIENSNTNLWSFDILLELKHSSNKEILSKEKELILHYGSICNYENQFDFSIFKDLLNYKYKFFTLEEEFKELQSKYNQIKDKNVNEPLSNNSHIFTPNDSFIFVKTTLLDDKYLNLHKTDKLKILMLGCNSTSSGKIVFKNNVPVKNKSGISKLLGLSNNRTILNNIFASGLIQRIDNGFYLQTDFIRRGSLQNKNGAYTRLFANRFNKLFENYQFLNRNTNNLASLCEIIPLINRSYNIISKNPFEKDLSKIIPMPTQDILTLCGYKEHCSRTNQSKVLNKLLSIHYDNNYLFKIIKINNVKALVVNPYYIYADSDTDSFGEANKYFSA